MASTDKSEPLADKTKNARVSNGKAVALNGKLTQNVQIEPVDITNTSPISHNKAIKIPSLASIGEVSLPDDRDNDKVKVTPYSALIKTSDDSSIKNATIKDLQNNLNAYKELVSTLKRELEHKPDKTDIEVKNKNKEEHVSKTLPRILQWSINVKVIEDITALFDEHKADLERNYFQNLDFDFSLLKQELAASTSTAPDIRDRKLVNRVNEFSKARIDFQEKYDKQIKSYDNEIATLQQGNETDTNTLDRIKKVQEEKKAYEEKAIAVYPLFIIDMIKKGHKEFNKSIIALLNNYKNKMTKFISKISRRLLYLQRWKRDIELKKQYNTKFTSYDEFLQLYREKINKSIESVKTAIISSLQTLVQKYNDRCVEFKNIIREFIAESDPIFIGFIKQQESVRKQIAATKEKLLSLYNNDRTIMDIVLDSKFISLYVLKFIHFAIFVAALFLTEKLFLEMYMKKVYAENSDPPSIYKMLGILLLIDIGFTLFLVTILVLLMYIFNSPDKNFIINSDLIITFLLDFGIYMFFVLMISMIIGSIIQMKRYFRYKTEGLRGIRAFKEIILGVAGSLVFIPFFIVL